jgi:hypothetical protein
MAGTTLRTAFELLDRWRHLPNYQLERRADIFFAAFLPGFIAWKEKPTPVRPVVIPELPLKRDLVVDHSGPASERSVKVDYVVFQEDLRRAFFVELKTDQTSLREDQYKYLARAAERGLHAKQQVSLCIVGAAKLRAT